MDIISVLILGAAGVGAGILAGLLGIGGGIVLVPALFLVFEHAGVELAVRMHAAVGTSLATIIPTSLASWRAHHARGAVDAALVRRWAPAIVLGAASGGVLARWINGPLLTMLFVVFAVIIAIRLVLATNPAERGTPAIGRFEQPIAAGIGLVSSWMGIGGGSLSVPALRATGRPIRRAVGTASALGFFIALPGAAGFALAGAGVTDRPPLSLGYVNFPALLAIAPATMLFAPVGARLAHWLRPEPLTRVFGGFLLLAAGRMAWKALA